MEQLEVQWIHIFGVEVMVQDQWVWLEAQGSAVFDY